MIRKFTAIIVTSCMIFACGMAPIPLDASGVVYRPLPNLQQLSKDVAEIKKTEPKPEPEPVVVEPEPVTTPQTDISEEEIRLIALIVMAEAEAEPEYGQRLVIDTILNRKDHEAFPDTVTEVVYQKNQFECVSNGRADRCYVKEELVQMVREEIANRTNYDVIFFRTKHYSPYGTPLFRECCHYFSAY